MCMVSIAILYSSLMCEKAPSLVTEDSNILGKTIFFKRRIYFKPVEDQCPTDLTGFFKIEWIERKGYVTLVANNTLF